MEYTSCVFAILLQGATKGGLGLTIVVIVIRWIIKKVFQNAVLL